MLRKDAIRQWISSHLMEAGENTEMAYENAASELGGWLEQGKVKLEDWRFPAIFEAVVPNAESLRGASVQQIAEAVSASAFPKITGTLVHRRVIDAYLYNFTDTFALATEDDAVDYPNSTVAGFGAGDGLNETSEFQNYDETVLTEKSVQVRVGKFGRMIGISREMVLFDKTAQVLRRAADIGAKAGHHRAKMIIQTIEMVARSAFSDETSTTLQGFVYNGTKITQAQFYANTHATVLDKQVNDNTVATALGTDGLDTAYSQFASMVDEQGEEISIAPDTLLVHAAKLGTADQLINSGTQYDTANRALSPFRPGGVYGGLRIVGTPFIGTSTTYYLGAFARQLLWLWGWRPETLAQGASSEASFNQDIVTRYRFSYMGGCAHTDYRNIIRGGV